MVIDTQDITAFVEETAAERSANRRKWIESCLVNYFKYQAMQGEVQAGLTWIDSDTIGSFNDYLTQEMLWDPGVIRYQVRVLNRFLHWMVERRASSAGGH